MRKPHVRAVWGRRVSKYSMVLGVEVEVWNETATGVLERLVGHCLGHSVLKCCWSTLQPSVPCTGVCSPSVFACEKENGYVQVGVEAVVLKQSWPRNASCLYLILSVQY